MCFSLSWLFYLIIQIVVIVVVVKCLEIIIPKLARDVAWLSEIIKWIIWGAVIIFVLRVLLMLVSCLGVF